MSRCVVPGTFDPVTSGHLDIIMRASRIFDDVIVGVASSPNKGAGPMFSLDERVDLLERAAIDLPNVTVRSFDTLLVDFAESVDATVIVKGLRAVTDFEGEFQMAALNWRLDKQIETMFIMAVPDYMYLSSSAVKEIASHGGPLNGLVPDVVRVALEEKSQRAR